MLFLCALLCSFALRAQNDEAKNITVTVEKPLSEEGQILIGLYTEENFMKGRGIKDTMIPANSKNIRAVFKNIPKGEYAIMAIHDENKNYRMDFDSSGMPAEGNWVSGNNYGPPEFNRSKFTLKNKDLHFEISF